MKCHDKRGVLISGVVLLFHVAGTMHTCIVLSTVSSILPALCLESELVIMRAQAERHSQEIRETEDKLTALREELDSAQVRIRELTSENVTMEAVKEDLEAKLEELVAEKNASENAKLDKEKMLSYQKGLKDKFYHNYSFIVNTMYL